MANFTKLALHGLMAIALAACAAEPAKYTAPTEGLVQGPGANAPVNARVTVRSPVGLVASNNVEAYLELSERVKAGLEAVPLQNVSAKADADPRYVVANVLQILQSRYPGITHLPNLAAAKRAGKKTTIIMDIQTKLGALSGQKTTVDISLVFVSETGQPVSRIVGRGSATVPYPAFSFGAKEAADQALRELNDNLAAAVQ